MKKIGLLESVQSHINKKPSALKSLIAEIKKETEFNIKDSYYIGKNSKEFEKRIGTIVFNTFKENTNIFVTDQIDFVREALLKHGLNIIKRVPSSTKNLMANLYIHFVQEHLFKLLISYINLTNISHEYKILSVEGWFYHFLIMHEEFRQLIFYNKKYHLFWCQYIPEIESIYFNRKLQTTLKKNQISELILKQQVRTDELIQKLLVIENSSSIVDENWKNQNFQAEEKIIIYKFFDNFRKCIIENKLYRFSKKSSISLKILYEQHCLDPDVIVDWHTIVNKTGVYNNKLYDQLRSNSSSLEFYEKYIERYPSKMYRLKKLR